MIFVEEGQSPLILCLPHSGTDVPPFVAGRLNATGRLQADLGWRLEKVFDFHGALGATVIRSSVSRYVIDLDRDRETPISVAEDPSLALCPVTTLDHKRIYKEGEEPGPTEVEQRMLLFYRPFHLALQQQIARLRRIHEKVILVDCQSMRSQIRGMSEKGLPMINIGSADGASCDPDLRSLFVGSFTAQDGYSVSVDVQTKGGFITRTCGQPAKGVHAMTLMLAQRSYLRHESPPFEPDKIRLARLRAILSDSFARLLDWTGMKSGSAGQPAGVAAENQPVSPTDGGHESGDICRDQEADKASARTARQEGAAGMDRAALPRVPQSRAGKVEDGLVTPLLVAE